MGWGLKMRAWVVRAGSNGEREEPELSRGIVAAGWPELGDITAATDRGAIRAALEQTYADAGYSPRVIGNWAGQLSRFRHDMSQGDLVVLPRRSRQLALGRIAGSFKFDPDAAPGLQHTRSVEWLRTDLNRTAVQQDLLDSMGSLLTIFELRRYDAANRVAAPVDKGTDPGPGDTAPDSPIFATSVKLLEAAVDAPADAPLTITVRNLLNAWGATRRSSTVVGQIEADLGEKGLTAAPPITALGFDSQVALLRVGAEPGPDQPLLTAGDVPDEAAEQAPLTYRIAHVASADCQVVSVRPEDTLRHAITKMVFHDFSQLPVLDGDARLRGAITWESIGKARMSGNSLSLSDVVVQPLDIHSQAELLGWIPQIHKHGYAFIRDDRHKITGIVTTADLTDQFGARVEPFVLLEELEQRLRRLLNQALERGTLTLDAIRSRLLPHRQKKVQAADDLTLGEYSHVLEPEEHWGALKWDADQGLVLAALRTCTKFRNKLMHFSPDPIPDEELSPVRGLLAVLRSLDPIA
ncbi:CBS domain-containing protein [Streptomyces lunaelactis]|uniref:CBS domain-containing protein n=1 Tax=Streptomyces lunaelactis TaxID=1535768 RepID=UPI001C311A51|nr:CBS domain-containing protein [Streptomyces lunaelactis]